jgi:hypothetical protein
MTPQLLYPGGEKTQYLLNRKLGGPAASLNVLKREKSLVLHMKE